ncbi:hypothetical protein Gasu2_51990, partial [Galdieria sulphuraria]
FHNSDQREQQPPIRLLRLPSVLETHIKGHGNNEACSVSPLYKIIFGNFEDSLKPICFQQMTYYTRI